MAQGHISFPNLKQHVSTDVTPITGVEIDISSTGSIRSRSLSLRDRYKIKAVYKQVTKFESQQLELTYAQVKNGSILDFTWQANNSLYYVTMTTKPKTIYRAPDVWDVIVELVGVKA